MKIIFFLGALWFAALTPISAAALERTPVPDARPLMLSALTSAAGEAHGVLTGPLAEALTQKFKATTPIFIDVTTVRRYQQPGCSRLLLTFWQEGVLLPQAKTPQRQSLEMGINFCRDGLPPRSLAERQQP